MVVPPNDGRIQNADHAENRQFSAHFSARAARGERGFPRIGEPRSGNRSLRELEQTLIASAPRSGY
jgi:hypothetical protein